MIYLQAGLKIFNILTAACSLENKSPWPFQDKNGLAGGWGSRLAASRQNRPSTSQRKKEEGRWEGGVNPREKLEESVSFRLHHREKSSAKGLGKIPCAPQLPPPPRFHLALLALLAKRANKAAFPRVLPKLRESHRHPPNCHQSPIYLFIFPTLNFIVIFNVIDAYFSNQGESGTWLLARSYMSTTQPCGREGREAATYRRPFKGPLCNTWEF